MRIFKIFLLCILFFLGQVSEAQKEAIYWYFGENSGLDFHYSPPIVLLGATFTQRECSTISDQFGNLLFYTDGEFVINKQHQVMKNGCCLHGKFSPPRGYGQSTQGVIIISHPGNKYQYYVFTSEPRSPYKFEYSIVDMSKQGGLGEVIVKNIVLIDSVCEKVSAVRHSNGKSIWVVTHKYNSDAYYSFEINGSGVISSPVISHSGKKITKTIDPSNKMGYMKISPDGKWIVTANVQLNLDISKFNPITGIVTYFCGLYQEINHPEYFCMEFSPDISKLYITEGMTTTYNCIWQIDLNAGDTIAVKNSKTCIGPIYHADGAIQIGIDKKIYFLSNSNVGVIKSPNIKGNLCDFNENYITLTHLGTYGLNNYIQSYFFNPDIKADGLCFHDSTRFSLSDTLGIDSVHWFFDDVISGTANFSYISKPFHIFSDTGLYHVRAIAFHNTLTDTSYREIYITPYPVANFRITDTFQCLKGNRYIFSDSSSLIKGTFEREWDFGDSTFSYVQQPNHSYVKEGNFQVKLSVLSDHGCSASKTKQVYVNPVPEANFKADSNLKCFSGNSFLFTPDSPRVAHQSDIWNFGDGLTDTSHIAIYSYSLADTFSVKLLTITLEGCKDSAIKSVIVNPSPSAIFNINDTIQCLNGNNFLFTKSDLLSVNSDLWNFGDSGMDTNKICNHSYLYPGTFIVKLISTNKYNCIDSTEKTVIVNPSPKAAFTVNDSIQCLKGNSFSFTDSSSFNASSGSWLWDFNDGNYDNSQSPTHIFISTATFDVKLIATDQYNCKDSISKQITVLPSTVASFTVNDTVECFKNNRFVFTNTGNLNAPIGNWYWDFGDGITNNAKNQIHSYYNTGTFTVKLLSDNQFSCPDSSGIIIKVNPSPNATFTINNPIQCLTGNSFSFTKSDQLSVYNDLWDFGDALTGSGKSIIHSYTSANTYITRLIVTTIDNCSDTTSQSVTIKPNPLKPTATNYSPLCEDETLNLNANTPETVNFDWSADNGFTSSLQNPVISNVRLRDSGVYYVKAIMNGCESNKDFTRVIINTRPFFSFDQNQTICPGDMILLDPGFFDSYVWQDNSVNRTFNITEPGLYKVIVFNTFGCNYSDSVLITKKCPTILFIPVAFTPNNDNINDRFEIITDNLREFDLKIYNRWGELIFHSSDPTNFWDGTYKNANCMDGVYYYQLETRDKDSKIRNTQGTVTLMR